MRLLLLPDSWLSLTRQMCKSCLDSTPGPPFWTEELSYTFSVLLTDHLYGLLHTLWLYYQVTQGGRGLGSKTRHLFSRVVVIQDPIQRLSPFQKKSTWTSICYKVLKNPSILTIFHRLKINLICVRKSTFGWFQFCIGKEGSLFSWNGKFSFSWIFNPSEVLNSDYTQLFECADV